MISSGTTSNLLHRVVYSVYANIEPHVKEMLMVGCIQQWRDHGSVLWRFPFVGCTERKNAGELYFKLAKRALLTWASSLSGQVQTCFARGNKHSSAAPPAREIA
jgi:hypothetical protein